MNQSEHIPFDARAVAEAPASPGVYILYRGDRVIYIGRAAAGATIRQCLEQHLREAGSRCTRAATEFDYEASRNPVPLYRHYLAVYFGAAGGVLPYCNERLSMKL